MNANKIAVFIICLIIAFALWVIHHLNQTYIRQYHLNAIVTQVPSKYEKDSIYIPLKIQVKGSGIKILLLENYYPDKIYIPFKKLKKTNKKGLFLIENHVISDNSQIPVKIKIQEVLPDTISIQLKNKDKVKKKK